MSSITTSLQHAYCGVASALYRQETDTVLANQQAVIIRAAAAAARGREYGVHRSCLYRTALYTYCIVLSIVGSHAYAHVETHACIPVSGSKYEYSFIVLIDSSISFELVIGATLF